MGDNLDNLIAELEQYTQQNKSDDNAFFRLGNAYRKVGNNAQGLAKEEYSRIEVSLRAFIKAFEKQWTIENKPFGFEVQHQRLGGQLIRIGACKKRLTDYASGKIDSIPELEEEILTFRKEGESIYYNDYARSCTPNPTHPA